MSRKRIWILLGAVLLTGAAVAFIRTGILDEQLYQARSALMEGRVSCLRMLGFGFLSSFHCIGMCGGSVMILGADPGKYQKNSVLYHGGRLICALLSGCLAGGLGAALSINPYIAAALPIFCGGCMVIAALQMLGLFRFLPPGAGCSIGKWMVRAESLGPAVLGMVTALLPCGMLQMAQLIALNSGHWNLGGALMGSFVIGTMPVMLLFGRLSGKISSQGRKYMQWASAAVVLCYAAKMISKGIRLL